MLIKIKLYLYVYLDNLCICDKGIFEKVFYIELSYYAYKKVLYMYLYYFS